MTSIKKTYKWIVGLISLIASVLTIIDLIENKPILSTLIKVSNWIWVNILNYNFPVWQILIGLITSYIILRLIDRKTATEKYFNKIRDYKSDEFDGLKWEWYWEYNDILQKYEIIELRPKCSRCGYSMQVYNHTTNTIAVCPNCDNKLEHIKSEEKVSSLILDKSRDINT